MKTIATLAACLAVALSSTNNDVPLWKKEITKAEYDIMNLPRVFEEWSKAFNKVYSHEEEKLHRFQTWLKNVEYIANHNSKEEETYKMRLNQFGDLNGDEFEQYIHGSKGSCFSNKDGKKTRRVLSANSNNNNKNKVKANPTSVDWTTQGVVTPVKNQGSCGSCWSFSATGATECRTAIATGSLVSLSEQQLVDCSIKDGNLGCDGGLMDDAFKYIKSNGGLCTEAAYPYTATDGLCKASSCGTFYDAIASYTDVVVDNEADLETAVVSGCVSVAVEADQSSFQFYSSGILTGNCGTSTDHGVLVVGYGVSGTQEYWKVKNSWGVTWGEEGYLLICKDCNKNGNMGECGINTDPSYPVH
jgi:C1A family cysteine protease